MTVQESAPRYVAQHAYRMPSGKWWWAVWDTRRGCQVAPITDRKYAAEANALRLNAGGTPTCAACGWEAARPRQVDGYAHVLCVRCLGWRPMAAGNDDAGAAT